MKEKWEEWWHFNQWMFTRIDSNSTQKTGGTATSEASDVDALAKFFRELGLADKHYDPKSSAEIALGKISWSPAKDELETLLKNRTEHNYVRESAALALGMMGSKTSAQLLLAIVADRSNELRLRVHAMIGLGLLKDPSAVGKVQMVLQRNDDLEVHVASAMALGLIGDASAAGTLARILGAGNVHDGVRAAAATSLGKIGLEKVDGKNTVELLTRYLLTDSDNNVRRAVALVMHRFHDDAVVPTLEKVVRLDKDDVTRGFAMLSLAQAVCKVDDSSKRRIARAVFERVLREGSDREVGYAAIALGLLGREDKECAVALRSAFQSQKTVSNQSACAIALGIMKDINSKQRIADVVSQQGGNPELRGYCCVALGLLGDNDPQISLYLRDIVEKVSIPELKAAAALALSKLGDRKALETLKKALMDRNRYFQMTAIMAIGYFRDFSTVKDLVEHFKRESNPEARAITVVALGYIGDVSKTPVLREISMDFNYLAVFQQMLAVDQIIRLF